MSMTLTYYGHACFGVAVNGKQLLFDPFITGNELAKDIKIDEVPADYILLSHAHQDHILDVEAIAQRTGAQLIAPFEVASWFQAKGIENVAPMNHGGASAFDFGRVKLTNAIHSSSFPDGTYGGHPAGFVVTSAVADEGSFYYAGDTALTYDMKLVGEEFALKYAVLPIGDHFTMGASDAVKAAAFVGATQVVGVHYDTFPPIKLDKAAAQGAFESSPASLHLPAIGESIDL